MDLTLQPDELKVNSCNYEEWEVTLTGLSPTDVLAALGREQVLESLKILEDPKHYLQHRWKNS